MPMLFLSLFTGLITPIKDTPYTYLIKTMMGNSQKYIKNPENIKKYMDLAAEKMKLIDTSLNSSGRMKQFMKEFDIEEKLLDLSESDLAIFLDIERRGRFHNIAAHKFIDADGRVYYMNYSMFFPTEIRFHIKDKTPTLPLANLKNRCLVTREIINREEIPGKLSDYI